MKTRWLPVKGYEGLYEVSDSGLLRSLPRRCKTKNGAYQVRPGKLLGHATSAGYVVVRLTDVLGATRRAFIHQLVLEAFVGECPSGCQALHGPKGSSVNRLSNLCWGTPSQNQLDRFRDGTDTSGERNPLAKLTKKAVRYIRTHYKRWDRQFGGNALAKKFGVTQGAIWCVVAGRTWRTNEHTA